MDKNRLSKITEKDRRRNRGRSAVLLSIIGHLLILNIMVFLPEKNYDRTEDRVVVDWIDAQPKDRLRRMEIKPPLKIEKFRKDNQKLALEAKLKKAETPKNDLTEVAELTERIISQNADPSKALFSEKIPDRMTAAKLRDAEASNLSRLVSNRAEVGGIGKVTGRDRLRGQRDGIDLVDSYGDDEDGLLGGGGNPGLADDLGIINFLGEFDGPQDVIFCLDISASMQAAGLKKLELSINSLKDALLALGDDDRFNIVTFYSKTRSLKKSLISAEMLAIEKTFRELDRFTPDRIANNLGTNILGAIETAFTFDPTIIVLITDGLPQHGDPNADRFEIDTEKILTAIRNRNTNETKFYVVALEIDTISVDKERLRFFQKLAVLNGGKMKLIERSKIQPTPRDETARSPEIGIDDF